MRRASIIFMVCCFLWGGVISTFAQEAEKQKAEDITTSELLKIGNIIYNPEGRRDPFRDLLTGSEVPEADAAKGVAGMFDADKLVDQIGHPDFSRILMAAALASS